MLLLVLGLLHLNVGIPYLHLQRIRWRHLAFPWFAAFRISIHVSTICMDDFAARVLAQMKSASACAIWGAGGFRAMSEKSRALSGPGEPGNFGRAGDPQLPAVPARHVTDQLERRRLELERKDAQQQEFLKPVAQMESVAEELHKTTVYADATDVFKPIEELFNDDEEDDVVEVSMPEAPRPASATQPASARPAKLPRPKPKRLLGVKVEPQVPRDIDREVMDVLHKLNKAEDANATAEAAQPDSGAAGSAAGSSGAAGSGQHGGSQHADVQQGGKSQKGRGFQVPGAVENAKGTCKSCFNSTSLGTVCASISVLPWPHFRMKIPSEILQDSNMYLRCPFGCASLNPRCAKVMNCASHAS